MVFLFIEFITIQCYNESEKRRIKMWVLFAFGSAFFAGITTILAKCGIKKTNSNIATAVRTIVVLFFAWLMVFITNAQGGITDINGRSWILLILSGAATGASWLCYFKALQLGDVNKVVPIDKSSIILTIILALIFFREPISAIKIISIIAIGAGTFMMIQKKESTAEKKEKGKSYLIYAVLSAVFASLTSILGKAGMQDINSNLGTAIRTCVVLIMAWVVVFVTKEQGEVKRIPKNELLFILLSGVATGASWLCYFKALQSGPASVVVPIDKLSIVVSIVFSYFVFGEKLSKKSFAGLCLIVAGTLAMLI